MTKYIYGFAALIALIVAAALVAPGFLDWSRHKTDIAALLQRATGHPVLIAGDVSVALLPTPSLEVRDIRLPAGPEAAGPDLGRIRSVRLDLALLPLVAGTVEARSITIVDPDLLVEVLPGGRLNWSEPASAAAEAAPGPVSDEAGSRADELTVRLDQIDVSGGRLTVRRAGGSPRVLSGIDASIKADSLAGPFRGRGTAQAGSVPVQFDFRLGRSAGDRLHLNGLGSAPSLGLNAELVGDIATEGRSGLTGRLRLEGPGIAPLTRILGDGPHRSLLEAALEGRFTLEGELVVAADTLGLAEFKLDSENNRATGSFLYRFQDGGRPDAVSAGLILQRVDLDRWRAARLDGETGSRRDEKPAGAADSPKEPILTLPSGLGGQLDIVLQAVVLNQSVVRDVQASLRLVDGELVINQAAARLPGGTRVALFGFLDEADGQPRFDGSIEATSDNLRGLLDWLAVDVSRIPTDRLRRWSMAGKLYAEADVIRLSQFTTELDLITLSGSLEAIPGPRPALLLTLDGDRLDLDAYLPRRAARAATPAGADAGDGGREQAAPRAAGFPPRLADVRYVDVDLKGRLGSMTYLGQDIRDVTFDIALDHGTVLIRELEAGDVAGSDVRISGRLGDVDAGRALEAELTAEAAEPAGFLELLGIDLPPDPRTVGALRLTTRLARTEVDQDWSVEAAIKLGAMATQIAGTAAFRPGSKEAIFTAELAADEIDLDLLTAVLTGSARPKMAPAARPVRAPPGRTPADGGARWSDTRFNPAVLRLPPAALTLRADRMIYLKQRIDQAELALTTEPGVLEVNSLTGRLHGGDFALTAKLSEAEARRIALTMNATLEGAEAASLLPIAELVTLQGGRLGLKIALTGSGRSPRALVASLTGKGRIWAEGGQVIGIDLARANQRIGVRDKAEGLVGVLAESATGATAVTSLGGDFRVDQGVLSTKTLRAVADGATAEISGKHDLLRREIDAELRLRFAAVPDAPPLLAKVRGPLGAGQVNIDFKELQGWLLKQPGTARRPGG